MYKDDLSAAYEEIEDFRDKLGETFFDVFQEEDNTTYEMAKGIIRVFSETCSTENEFNVADAMLTAVCGYTLSSLLEKIRERDKNGYPWVSG